MNSNISYVDKADIRITKIVKNGYPPFLFILYFTYSQKLTRKFLPIVYL